MVEHEVAHAQECELVDPAAPVRKRTLPDAAQACVVVPLQRVLASEGHPCITSHTVSASPVLQLSRVRPSEARKSMLHAQGTP